MSNESKNIKFFLLTIFFILAVVVGLTLFFANNERMSVVIEKSEDRKYDYVLSINGKYGFEAMCMFRVGEKIVSHNTNSLSTFSNTKFYIKSKYLPLISSKEFNGEINITLFQGVHNGINETQELIVRKVKPNKLSPEEKKKQKLNELNLKENEKREQSLNNE